MSWTKEEVMGWLEEVKDPEIPVLSLVDLGVITSLEIVGDAVTVEMTPTFTGCPALEIMKQEVVAALTRNGVKQPIVTVTFNEAWTSDKISAKGKTALKRFGLAPPPDSRLFKDLEILEVATCPHCDSTDTELKSLFGATLCRAIYVCRSCHEGFEQFKPL